MAPKDPTTYKKNKNSQWTGLFWPLEFLIRQICMKTGELMGLYDRWKVSIVVHFPGNPKYRYKLYVLDLFLSAHKFM